MTAHDPQVHVEPSATQAVARAEQLVRTVLVDAVKERGVCTIALAGGTTPHPLYQRLAASATDDEVPWSQAEIFFGDERDVPHDHEDSNYHMAQRVLLDHLPIRPEQIHPMPADADDLDDAAAEYEQTLRRLVPAGPDGIPQFDLVLLGMGGDGHTASLFPCTPDALGESERLVLAHEVPVLGRWRMTFTFPLINAARSVVMFVVGEDKDDAVAKVLRGVDPTDAPAAGVRPTRGELHIVLDSAAARLRPR